ncbi:uncharacterized protein F5891DRAFT_1177335 [Suillus fuscotomentosus]|uniref:Uncharacterized protein n=1 Tax=Suillus fuscotomentosus TaxID=1912939 RepID=A0AAD4DPV4_9AGAM|nr:uncharacterized protein F5891DRAFT_1177335 [Suillus fuscotomentosus]KAG1888490.1 hypothetical protein F5891DRAFT_1177335 [Suillus fuscotomentosus]
MGLTDELCRAVVGALTVIEGGKEMAKKVNPLLRTSFCNPRLDAEVSKHRNHLLKVPFCVCVPVDPNRMENFDPNAVPTVMQLLQELDKAGEGANWEHTSLKPYVDMLDRHVMGILDDVRRRERAKAVLQHTINSISSLPLDDKQMDTWKAARTHDHVMYGCAVKRSCFLPHAERSTWKDSVINCTCPRRAMGPSMFTDVQPWDSTLAAYRDQEASPTTNDTLDFHHENLGFPLANFPPTSLISTIRPQIPPAFAEAWESHEDDLTPGAFLEAWHPTFSDHHDPVDSSHGSPNLSQLPVPSSSATLLNHHLPARTPETANADSAQPHAPLGTIYLPPPSDIVDDEIRQSHAPLMSVRLRRARSSGTTRSRTSRMSRRTGIERGEAARQLNTQLLTTTPVQPTLSVVPFNTTSVASQAKDTMKSLLLRSSLFPAKDDIAAKATTAWTTTVESQPVEFRDLARNAAAAGEKKLVNLVESMRNDLKEVGRHFVYFKYDLGGAVLATEILTAVEVRAHQTIDLITDEKFLDVTVNINGDFVTVPFGSTPVLQFIMYITYDSKFGYDRYLGKGVPMTRDKLRPLFLMTGTIFRWALGERSSGIFTASDFVVDDWQAYHTGLEKRFDNMSLAQQGALDILIAKHVVCPVVENWHACQIDAYQTFTITMTVSLQASSHARVFDPVSLILNPSESPTSWAISTEVDGFPYSACSILQESKLVQFNCQHVQLKVLHYYYCRLTYSSPAYLEFSHTFLPHHDDSNDGAYNHSESFNSIF